MNLGLLLYAYYFMSNPASHGRWAIQVEALLISFPRITYRYGGIHLATSLAAQSHVALPDKWPFQNLLSQAR